MVSAGTDVAYRFRNVEVIDEFDFSTKKDVRIGYRKAVQLVRSGVGAVEVHVCYFSRRKRSDGTYLWVTCTRPLEFSAEDARAISEGISVLLERNPGAS